MSIFSGLFRSRDKPQNSTAGSSYSFFMGSTTAGKSVTERSSMQMTAVYSCVRILAEAVAGLPVHLYRYTESGGKEKAIDHPLYLLLHDEPNPEMSSFVFRETLMTHLLLWGNAYAQVIRNGKGEVIRRDPGDRGRELRPEIHPSDGRRQRHHLPSLADIFALFWSNSKGFSQKIVPMFTVYFCAMSLLMTA